MNLIEREDCYIFDIGPQSGVTSGFTKPSLKGDPCSGLKKALSWYEGTFGAAYMNQVHGAKIEIIEKPARYECDGLFTKSDNLALAIKTADCLPLLFYSKKKDMIGAVHMGWRSADEGILENIPFDLSSFTVIAGPGMRRCCYEIGDEFLGHPRLEPFLIKCAARYYFDSVKFAQETLKRHGLEISGFFDADICSYCSDYNLFSYRKDGTADRTISFIIKKPSGV